MAAEAFPQGTVHEAADDLQAAIRADSAVFGFWQRLTPLGRNEFICWVDDAKQAATRDRRIRRTCEELLEGKKRPCCWAGCVHRNDKAPQQMAAGGADRQERETQRLTDVVVLRPAPERTVSL